MPIYLSPQEVTIHANEIKDRGYIESEDIPLFFGYLIRNPQNPYFSQEDYERIDSLRLKSLSISNNELVSFIKLFPYVTTLSLVDLNLTEEDLKQIAEKCSIAVKFFFSQCPQLKISSFKKAFGDYVEIVIGEYGRPWNFPASESSDP